jgi:hypothetical protein
MTLLARSILFARPPTRYRSPVLPFGFAPVGSTAEEFKAYLRRDVESQRSLVEAAGLKPR